MPQNTISSLIQKTKQDLLRDWIKQQLVAEGMRQDLIKEEELKAQSAEFLDRFALAVETDGTGSTRGVATSERTPLGTFANSWAHGLFAL